MQEVTQKLFFASDYQEGCLPQILDRLTTTNMEHAAGYGLDPHSKHARELIRTACGTPEAEIQFLVGGTQANEVTIACALHPWQAVVAATSGHVSVHEAGAIEAGGHKVIELPQREGKINAQQVEACAEAWETDGNRDHMIQPGMVYVSQPTECGTLYTRAELEALSAACHAHGMLLYVDGARLAYALAAPENDVTLTDLGRLCDAFYIGGTKCGALCGEAIVFPREGTCPRFFTRIKQHGALFAKGRLLGVQFGALFTDDLYFRLGHTADEAADRIRARLRKRGYPIYIDSPTNQTFFVIEDAKMAELGERVMFNYDYRYDETHTVIRLCTSWATRAEDVDALLELL